MMDFSSRLILKQSYAKGVDKGRRGSTEREAQFGWTWVAVCSLLLSFSHSLLTLTRGLAPALVSTVARSRSRAAS